MVPQYVVWASVARLLGSGAQIVPKIVLPSRTTGMGPGPEVWRDCDERRQGQGVAACAPGAFLDYAGVRGRL